MDPRKAATVTAPDLLNAFEEGSGGVGKGGQSELKVYLSLLTKDGKDFEVTEYPLHELDVALFDLRRHLSKGEGHGAAIVIDTSPPEVLSQITE